VKEAMIFPQCGMAFPFALILIRRKHPLGQPMRQLPPFCLRTKLCSDLCGHSFGHFFGQVAMLLVLLTGSAFDASLEICITTRRKTKQLATVWRPNSTEKMDLGIGMGWDGAGWLTTFVLRKCNKL